MERVGDLIARELPWETANYKRVQELEARLARAREEYVTLLLENRTLRKQLREAKRRLDLWHERDKAGRVGANGKRFV